MLFFCMFVYTVPRSANQNLRLFTLLALSFEGSLEGPRSAPAIVAAGPTLPRHSPASVFHFPASLSPFRINTYEISCKCCKQRTYRIAKSFRFHTYKKHGGVGVLWLTNSLQALMGKKRIYAKPLSPCFLFAAHSSKFRIPQVLCLPARRGGPLLRKLPGASQQFPFWNSILSSALPPRSQRLRVILFRSSLLNFQPSTVNCRLPFSLRYTIRFILGEPHADPRGRLETALRVHRFREPAQAHACRRSVCPRLRPQNRRRRRNLEPRRAAARFRLRALAQPGALPRPGASLRRREDSARAGLLRRDRPRHSFSRGLLQRPARIRAGAYALRLRRARRLPHRLRLRPPIEKHSRSRGGLREAPHERQTLRQRRLPRRCPQRRRRTRHPARGTHHVLHRRHARTSRRPRPSRHAVEIF